MANIPFLNGKPDRNLAKKDTWDLVHHRHIGIVSDMASL